MKRLLLILILTFSFQTLTKADDIRDFEIEGMSIGDSLLDFFTEDELEKDFFYKSNKWAAISKAVASFEVYEGFQVHVKANDKNYIIGSLEGMIIYENQIEKCHKKQQEIIYELDNLFKYTKKKEWDKTHAAEKNSTTKAKQYTFENGDIVAVICYDWSENNKYKFVDKLGVSIKTKEFQNWVNNEAY